MLLQLLQRLVDRKHLDRVFLKRRLVLLEFFPTTITAAFESLLPPRGINSNLPHDLRCNREEVLPAFAIEFLIVE